MMMTQVTNHIGSVHIKCYRKLSAKGKCSQIKMNFPGVNYSFFPKKSGKTYIISFQGNYKYYSFAEVEKVIF